MGWKGTDAAKFTNIRMNGSRARNAVVKVRGKQQLELLQQAKAINVNGALRAGADLSYIDD